MNALSGLLIAITALAILSVLLFVVKRKNRASGLSPMASLSFAFIIAGILFGNERWLGYSLMGVGVALAVVDIINKYREGHTH